MRYLTLEEILVLHAYQIDNYGGNPNVRDIKLLESAILRPQTSFTGKDIYNTVHLKAAALAVGIIQNHPFIDGNKRTGIHAMLVFLELNEVNIVIRAMDLVKLANDIATKNTTVKQVAKFLKDNTSQHPPR
jgi:death-on-curing protein